MKTFLIKYMFKAGTREQWHQEIERFITALNTDPEIKGRISYRCMKNREGDDYYHLATTMDDSVAKVLQSRDFFPRYQAQTKTVGGGVVEVIPLEVIAETQFRA